ncbi:hypothetical protein MLD38_038140 [Melastoma candidum]|nr:hypothetical protein MLD38_038140 [Melastoma candidum]
MIYFFCTSDNTEKAIQIIGALIPSVKNSDEQFALLLTCIISCLTTADKCIFWICCVYLVIYRKLPNYVVEQLECEKELQLIEWPSVDLNDDDKQRALQLVELAVQQFESCMIDESVNNDYNVRVAPRFGINHFWCMSALDGLQCSRNLLIKYMKMFPNSVELLLLSARANISEFPVCHSAGFEDVLLDWPENVQGIQCIWNQYAQWALQSGSLELAKEIMVRWFSCEWKAKSLTDVLACQANTDILGSSLIATSHVEGSVSSSSRLDEMFGFLNFSLYSLLHQQYTEARAAADKALQLATHETIKHCIKEHAKLLLVDGSVPKDGAHLSNLLGVLRTYLDCYHEMPVSEPLSKRFVEDVRKPRVRELIKGIFCPVSNDFFVVDIVLEAWWGPTLLPPKFCKVKDLVDLVESVMEISPANYHLAIHVVKYLTREYNSKDVASASLFYWAGSLLVSTLSHAVPVAPEYAWVESAEILESTGGKDTMLEGFYRKALLAYPFSKKLQKLSSRLLLVPTEIGCNS